MCSVELRTVIYSFRSYCVGKSTLSLVSFANYDWFEEWKDDKVTNRGSDYKELKQAFTETALQVVLDVFPQITRDKVMLALALAARLLHHPDVGWRQIQGAPRSCGIGSSLSPMRTSTIENGRMNHVFPLGCRWNTLTQARPLQTCTTSAPPKARSTGQTTALSASPRRSAPT